MGNTKIYIYGGEHMKLNLEEVFNQYPSPFFIIKPMMEKGITYNFKYLYVNPALAEFLGMATEELIGHTYQECFGTGEQDWLDRFADTAMEKKHFFVNEFSYTVGRKIYAELFHIMPDLCGCIIHDFQDIQNDLEAQENAALIRKAKCDCLTGFYNRFYLDELTKDSIHRNNVGISFVDINNLKVMNDTYGHDAGDKLIIKVSEMLRAAYHKSEIFRIGGDEFVVITQGYEKDGFLQMCEQTQETFRKDDLAAIGYQFYEKMENLKAGINECDVLMYEEKRRMKKRVR
jgi:diguanylate cyclase (GGDEF)-like protein